MLTIENYSLISQLYEGSDTLVYRATALDSNHPVVLKVLKHQHPTPEQSSRFRREFDIIHRLNLPGIVRALNLFKTDTHLVMVLEDVGGQSLTKQIPPRGFSLDEFLPLALRVADILGQVHQHGVIHKDINPANIVWNRETDSVKLIDFGLSSISSHQNPTLENPNSLEGTLAYISPEQTGRMNRVLDYRADFYSLGVTFYELLTAHLPFETTDPLELVHAHIAKPPPPPHSRNPSIPQPLSDIILKLMAKDAEDRYFSATGLKHDLNNCHQHWRTDHHIPAFTLGEKDVSDRLQIPQKLYGRKAELDLLQAAFMRVSATSEAIFNDPLFAGGRSEMVLVTGTAGSGKSALVQGLRRNLADNPSYFISGKFEQFQRNVPYASLIQALQSLIGQLLAESEAQIKAWRDRLLSVLGHNAQVMIDVLPDLSLILGPQPQAPALGPLENQNRFKLLFQNFIRVFARSNQPLVMFLDDLQWADDASLRLIELLMTAPDSHHILMIATCRSEEISGGHPLLLTLDEVRMAGVNIKHLSLNRLSESDTTALIQGTFRCSPTEAEGLAHLVAEKTGGNPFFIGEFLKNLHAENIIYFNYTTGAWQWSLKDIETRAITDNMVSLMTDRVAELPAPTRDLLTLAACIGYEFTLQTMAQVLGKPMAPLAAQLWLAMETGLIILLSKEYQLAALNTPENTPLAQNTPPIRYKFAHDRVQQAVYDSLTPTEQATWHWRIGQNLYQHIDPAQYPEKIFDVVNQLNLGHSECEQVWLGDETAHLNLIAGQKAKASAAYQVALSYFNVGLKALENPAPQAKINVLEKVAPAWERQYELTLHLHTAAMEAAYLNTDFEQMARWGGVVLKEAHTPLDRVHIHEIELLAHLTQSEWQTVIDKAIPVLRRLAIRFPIRLTQEDMMFAMQEIELALSDRKPEDLLNLPEMTDPYRLATMRLLSSVAGAAYYANPELLPFLVFKLVTLSIRYGKAPESALAYATHGLVLCGRVNDLDQGYQFGQLAMQMLDRIDTAERNARTRYTFYTFVHYWKEAVQSSLKPLTETYRAALETGDLECAARSAYIYGFHALFSGQDLGKLDREMAAYNEAIDQLRQPRLLHLNKLYRQMVLNLRGKYSQAHSLPPNISRHFAFNLENPAAAERSLIFNRYFAEMVLAYLFNRPELALEKAAIAAEHLSSIMARFSVPLFYFYQALIQLDCFTNFSKAEQENSLALVQANLGRLQTWANHAPSNFSHKVLLIKAELAWVRENYGAAREYYDQALRQAQQNQYLNEEALIYERATKFYTSRHQSDIAQIYFQKAHYAYTRWNASAKVKQLEQRYEHLMTSVQTSQVNTRRTLVTTQTTHSPLNILDLTSVLKASQAMSNEIRLDRLMTILMSVVLENAGAERGFLLLKRGETWFIEAEGSVNETQMTTMQGLSLENFVSQHSETNPPIPTAILNYVLHTKNHLVLKDAVNEGAFTQDAYVQTRQPKSVLCMPITNQGELLGLLYLENNLVTSAFTQDRLEILTMLSSQAAISIKNAQLYENITALNKAYARFVPQQFLSFLKKESIIDVELGDQVQQVMTILFSDIRDFTTRAEEMTPAESFYFVNDYLSRMEPHIIEHNGFIDKYIGDAIMALFHRTADDALRGSIAMLRTLSDFNAELDIRGQAPITIGIGLHTGLMMMGTVGGHERMDGTVISDAVNLASRVENLTKRYNVSLLITEQTYINLANPSEYAIREIERVAVKGKSEAVTVYEVFDTDSPTQIALKQETQPQFETAIAAYRQAEFETAQAAFEQICARNPQDKPAALYQRLCEYYRTHNLPPDWKGISSLSEK